MDHTKRPQIIKGSNPLMSFMEWRQHKPESSTYDLYLSGHSSGIIGFVNRYNNRGLTLDTFSLNGETVTFSLKPSQFDFIYQEE
jgi:hypothetical protein